MRDELRKIGGEERHEFTATFERTGWKDGYKGSLRTVLLLDVEMDGRKVADHLWMNFTKGFEGIPLKQGDRIKFNARVSMYEKGYKGWRWDVYKPIEKDYKLSYPTKINKIEDGKEK